MKEGYQESKETCEFLAKCIDYIQIGKDKLLKTKLTISLVNILSNRKALGYNGIFYKPTKLGKIFRFVFPNISRVYCLPGVKLSMTPRAKRAYQEWCKEFSWVGPKLAKIICDEVTNIGNNYQIIGELNWTMLQEDNNYIPIITEIKFLFMSLAIFLMGENPYKK